MPDQSKAQTADVVVLGAGIVGVSAAYATRQRGLSVILIDRREPGSETSYGNAGILSSGSILPLNKPSLFRALPGYITNQSAALRWDPGWAIRNIDWVARFLANAAPSRVRPRATALHGLIGASLKLHREWIVKADAGNRIRETGWLKAWRSDAISRGKGRAGLSRRLWHRKPIARPPGHFRARAEHFAGLQGWPAAHADGFRRLAGRRGQGLREDVCGLGRRDPPVGHQGDRARWRRLARDARRWRDVGAPCRGRAGALVAGPAAAARLSRSHGLRARLPSGVQAEPGTRIATSDP